MPLSKLFREQRQEESKEIYCITYSMTTPTGKQIIEQGLCSVDSDLLVDIATYITDKFHNNYWVEPKRA